MNRGREQGQQVETVTVNTLALTREQVGWSTADLILLIRRIEEVSEEQEVQITERNPGKRANGESSEPFLRYRILSSKPKITKPKHSLF